MKLAALWKAIETSPLGDYIASSELAFPMIESLHVIAIVTVVGSILMMDLRLLGLASKETPVTEVSRDTLPYTWGAFILAAITGTLLFISKASTYAIEPWYLSKMVLIVIAGVNMIVFHLTTWRTVGSWDTGPVIPLPAKVAGALSLFFWLVVVFCARAIGFTLSDYQQ